MNTSAANQRFEDLDGALRVAVEEIVAAPVPPGCAERVMDRAANWEAPAVRAQAKRQPSLYLAAGTGLALAVLVAVAVAIVAGLRKEKPVAAPTVANHAEVNEKRLGAVPAAPRPSEANDGGTVAPTEKRAGIAAPSVLLAGASAPHAFGAAGANPSRRMTVAEGATILVSTGGKEPIRLGERQPFTSESILHVWDWSTDEKSRPLETSCPSSFAISPDGKWIVTIQGEKIDVATGNVTRLPNFESQPHRILFSRDARRMALLLDGEDKTATFRILEFPSGAKLCEIENQWPAMLPAAFTPAGSEIFLMGKDNFIRRFDAATGQELQKYEPAHENSVRAMIVSPSGKLLVSGGSRGDILLWDVASGKLLHKLAVEPAVYAHAGVDSLAFSPDETLVAGGGLGGVILWSVETGAVTKLFPPESGSAAHIRFSADGKTITAVHGFGGTTGPAGENLLAYPAVSKWDVAKAKDLRQAQAAGQPEAKVLPEGQNATAKEEKVRALIDDVLAAHGGEEKLNQLTSFTMTVEHSNGETQHYFVQPPKKFRWETTHPDRTGKRIVILFPEGRRWWHKEPNEPAREFLLTGVELPVEIWLDYVKFFGPRQVLRLKDPDHQVTLVDESAKVGDRAAVCVQVTGPHYDHKMYFDKETHLLLQGFSVIMREVTYSDYKKFEGIPIAQKEDDGHFLPRITGFKVVEKFDAKLFEQP